MALGLSSYQIQDYCVARANLYKTRIAELREILTNPPSVEPDKVADNQMQDILLMLMEDEIVTTQVRLESSFYLSIIPQVSAFRDFLISQRFLVGMLRKDFRGAY